MTKREPIRNHSEIFMPRFPLNVQPRRILVEGQAGVGKSTFAAKLSHDWASGKEYLAPFEVRISGAQEKSSFQEASRFCCTG